MSLRPFSPARRRRSTSSSSACFDRLHRRAEAAAAGEPARAERRRHAEAPRVVERLGQIGAAGSADAPAVPPSSGPKTERIDHLLGDRLHPRPELERLADRPAPHARRASPRPSSRRRLRIRLPWKRRQHQAAPGHVPGLLQQHHRARAEHRPQQRVGEGDAEAAGGAVKTRLTSSGSQRKTHVPECRMRRVKASP